jgi:hypothetical protein
MADFTKVARILCGGPPEEWVIPNLMKYARLVGLPRSGPEDWEMERKGIECIQYLEDLLPGYALLGEYFGVDVSPLDDAMTNLHEVKEYLQVIIEPSRRGGPTPDRRKRLCAMVCASTWKELQGEAQPYSTYLQAACEEYWRACGHTDDKSIDWEHYLSHP